MGERDRRDMVDFLWILMIPAPVLLGSGVMGCLYGKNRGRFALGEVLPAGFCVLIGVAEAAHLAAVFLQWPVSRMALLWIGMVGALAVASVIVMIAGNRGKKAEEGGSIPEVKSSDTKEGLVARRLVAGAFVLSALFQVIVILMGDLSCNLGDMTLETVQSFLAEGEVYGVNPLTGQPYVEGIPLRLKILCLPSLYASVCCLTGLDAELVVCRIVPVVVLLGSYFAYSLLGKVLFGKDRMGRWVMLLIVSVLFWCGDYMDAMDGFLLLHGGYRGVAIRNGILIPFTLGMSLKKKWKGIALAILAEACMVWTFYGLGACLLVVVGMLFVHLWIRVLARRGGEACGN